MMILLNGDGVGFLLLVLAGSALFAVGSAVAVDEPRVQAVAKMLNRVPAGFGQPVTDRESWSRVAARASYRNVVRDAEKLLTHPMPATSDDLYLEYSRNGNRTRWQQVAGQRRGRISKLALAECIENKGRFLGALEETLREICKERTWLMPAHDHGLHNFNRTTVDIDLGSAGLAWEMATCYYLLGEKLSPATRQLVHENIERRILQPFRDMAAGKRKANWWFSTTNNWNAVCLACVTGTALIMIEDQAGRAFFVTAAEAHIRNFLRGFTPDGYCSEGVGYWNYGFGHFVLLTEAVRQATDGKLDFFAGKSVRQPSLFPARIEIVNDVYPAFADCSVGSRPSFDVMSYVNARHGLELPEYASGDTVSPGALDSCMLYSFPERWLKAQVSPRRFDEGMLRSWFPDAGILVCRPEEGTDGTFGAAMKGGHNDEHHNHNDVGSYLVVVGDKQVLTDPGAEVYTSRTFSSKRYDSKVLNSYGHPVPVIGGELQNKGRQARGKVLKSEFSRQRDTLVIDMRPAYTVPKLEKLERTFVYRRGKQPFFTVTDSVSSSDVLTYETALVTFGKWRQENARIIVEEDGVSVTVDIDTGGKAFDVKADILDEDVRAKTRPTRIGITLRQPVTEATVTLMISPNEP